MYPVTVIIGGKKTEFEDRSRRKQQSISKWKLELNEQKLRSTANVYKCYRSSSALGVNSNFRPARFFDSASIDKWLEAIG